ILPIGWTDNGDIRSSEVNGKGNSFRVVQIAGKIIGINPHTMVAFYQARNIIAGSPIPRAVHGSNIKSCAGRVVEAKSSVLDIRQCIRITQAHVKSLVEGIDTVILPIQGSDDGNVRRSEVNVKGDDFRIIQIAREVKGKDADRVISFCQAGNVIAG